MRKRCITLFAVIAFTFCIVLTAGCSKIDSLLNSPPNVTAVKQQLDDNYNAISVIIEFLLNQEAENVYIQNTDGTMIADLTEIKIQDSEVTSAINQIIGSGSYKQIRKIGDKIDILQWTGLRDIGCGIIYTTEEATILDDIYITQYQSLGKENWYYYISEG